MAQEPLSFRAGLSRPYIRQVERDMKSPTVDTLFRIRDARQVSAADIVGWVRCREEAKAGVVTWLNVPEPMPRQVREAAFVLDGPGGRLGNQDRDIRRA
jgi:transcriptional regulator with XRE-family HTH domain